MSISILMRENLNGTITSSAIIQHLSSHAEYLHMQTDKQLWIKSNSSIHRTNLTLARRFTKFVLYINVLLEDDCIFISFPEMYSTNLTQNSKARNPNFATFPYLENRKFLSQHSPHLHLRYSVPFMLPFPFFSQ